MCPVLGSLIHMPFYQLLPYGWHTVDAGYYAEFSLFFAVGGDALLKEEGDIPVATTLR